jgi:hypothetical protein
MPPETSTGEARWRLSSRSLTIPTFVVPTIAGVVIGGLAAYFRASGAVTWLADLTSLVVFILPIIFGMVVGLTIRVIELSNGIKTYTGELNTTLLAPLQREFQQLERSVNEVALANERMGKLDRLLRSEAQFDRVHAIARSWSTAYKARDRFSKLSSVIDWKRQQADAKLDQIAAELGSIVAGRIEIDDPVKEFSLNSELIRLIATKQIRAVSFEDSAFWESAVGRRTLQINKEFLSQPNRKIRRLFIQKSPDEYRDLLREQVDSGVTVGTIAATDVPGIYNQYEWDFVVYDEVAVRIGYLPKSASNSRQGVEKFAAILMDTDDIQTRCNQFEALWEISDRFL